MSATEPDGCYFSWADHTCLEDIHHDGPHVCGCGVTEPSVQECGRPEDGHTICLDCGEVHCRGCAAHEPTDPEPRG